MKDFGIAMVKSVTGIDISVHRDYFMSGDSDGPYVWFVDVPYNGEVYKTVKVYPHCINFYKNHPLAQKGPNIKFTLGVKNEEHNTF